MKKLHNKLIVDKIFVPKKGQRDLLCSNKKSIRCPFLGINSNSPEDVMLDYFASILVQAFLDKKNENNKQSKGSNICPSLHKGTGG